MVFFHRVLLFPLLRRTNTVLGVTRYNMMYDAHNACQRVY